MSGLIRLAFLLVFIDVIGGYVSSPSWFPGGNTCLKAARLSKGKSPLRLGGRGAAVISCVSMLGGDGQDGGGRSMNELDRAKEALAKLMERKRVQGEGSTLGSTRGASHEPPSDKRVHVAVQDRPRSSSPLFGSVGAGYGTARPPSRPAEEAQAGFDLQRLHVRGVQEARRPDINQLLHDTRNNAASSSVRTSSPPAQQESGVKNAPGGRDGEQGAQGRRSQSASHQRTLDEIKKIVGGLKQVTEQQKEREIEESLSAGNRGEPEGAEGRNSQGATFFRNAAKLTAEAIRKNGGRDDDDIEYRNFQKRLSRDPNQEAMLKYLEDAGVGPMSTKSDGTGSDPGGNDAFNLAFGSATNVPRRNVAKQELVKEDRESEQERIRQLDEDHTHVNYLEVPIPIVGGQLKVTDSLSTWQQVVAWKEEVNPGYVGDAQEHQTRRHKLDLSEESPETEEGVDHSEVVHHFDELPTASSLDEPQLVSDGPQLTSDEPQLITAFRDNHASSFDWEDALESELGRLMGSSGFMRASATSLGPDFVESYGSILKSEHAGLANFGSFDQELGLQWKSSHGPVMRVGATSSLSSLEDSLLSALKVADGSMFGLSKEQTIQGSLAVGGVLGEDEMSSLAPSRGQVAGQQVDLDHPDSTVDVKAGTTSLPNFSDATNVPIAQQSNGNDVSEKEEEEEEDTMKRDVVGSADWDDELDDEDDLYDELENEFLTQSIDEGDYNMFVVYVKSDRIGIRTTWPDGFETMEEFYLDQSINGQILEEDDIDDALISSAAGVHEAARIQLEGGALSKTNGENSSTFSSLNVAMNRVTTSSSPAKHSASASPQLSSQDTPSQSTTSHPFRPASSNVRDLPGLDVGTAVRITSRNCRHKDMVGTLVAFVGNGKRARVKIDGVDKTLLLQVQSLVHASLDTNDRPGLRDRTVPPAVLNSKTAWAWWKVRGGSSGP